MGTWGTGIDENDTFGDVYDDFFRLYNEGLEIPEITRKLMAEHKEPMEEPDDSDNFWFALAKAQWECKALDREVFDKVKSIVESGRDLEVWKDLGGAEDDVAVRKTVLEDYLKTLSAENLVAKPRVKTVPKKRAPQDGGLNPLWVLLVFGVLFLVSSLGHFLRWISDPSNAEGWACLGLSVFCLGAFAILREEKKRREAFVGWIAQNREAILAGRARYEGHAVTLQTQLVQFTVVISLVVITTRVSSRFFFLTRESTIIQEQRAADVMGVVYSLITLVTGWWGIPHGPIYTVQSVYRNLTHRSVMTVAQILGME